MAVTRAAMDDAAPESNQEGSLREKQQTRSTPSTGFNLKNQTEACFKLITAEHSRLSTYISAKEWRTSRPRAQQT